MGEVRKRSFLSQQGDSGNAPRIGKFARACWNSLVKNSCLGQLVKTVLGRGVAERY